jgi:hypothetical protein
MPQFLNCLPFTLRKRGKELLHKKVLESTTDTIGENNECNHIMRQPRDNPNVPSATEIFIVLYNQVSPHSRPWPSVHSTGSKLIAKKSPSVHPNI